MSVTRIHQLSGHEKVIVLIGRPGAGKSTFIDHATRQNGKNARHNLGPGTTEIQAFKYNALGEPYVLVDTPGFDDDNRMDDKRHETLFSVVNRLQKIYKNKKVSLSGVIYLHKISDNRTNGSPLKSLQTFMDLCGIDASQNAIFATTMWSNIQPNVGDTREDKLMAECRKDPGSKVIDLESQVMRFEKSFRSAWDIIGRATSQDTSALVHHQELAELEELLRKTEPGGTLFDNLRELVLELKGFLGRLRDKVGAEESEELVRKPTPVMQNLEINYQEVLGKIEQMRVPLAKGILTFLKESSWVARILLFFGNTRP